MTCQGLSIAGNRDKATGKMDHDAMVKLILRILKAEPWAEQPKDFLPIPVNHRHAVLIEHLPVNLMAMDLAESDVGLNPHPTPHPGVFWRVPPTEPGPVLHYLQWLSSSHHPHRHRAC